MEIVSFGPEVGRSIDAFGSDFLLAPLMQPTDRARTVCMHLGPGGHVGEHETVGRQLFCVVAGEGWVSGPDGRRVAISPMQGALWEPGERHAAGSDVGLVAFVVEGDFTHPTGAAAAAGGP